MISGWPFGELNMAYGDKNKYVVNRQTGCWDWTGAKRPSGHGLLWYGGRLQSAYKYFYERDIAILMDGFELHHKCNNPGCVNPKHLQAVTRSEHQMIQPTHTKRSPARVAEVIRLRDEDQLSFTEIAFVMGISATTAHRAYHGLRGRDSRLNH